MLAIQNPRSSGKPGCCCFKYSSTQVNVSPELRNRIVRWGQRNVKDADIYVDEEEPPSRHSREYESHVTLLYGIHEADPKRVFELFRGVRPFWVDLGRVSLFKRNARFDVVKIEASSPRLHELNGTIRQRLTTTQLYPGYDPHITVAFVRKGLYDHLEGHSAFAGLNFVARDIHFSTPHGVRATKRLDGVPGDRRRCEM